MNISDYLIDFIIVLIAAVIILALFPSILDFAKKPLSNLNYTDLSFSEQSIISSTFNQFANNLDNCVKNGKEKCLCVNVIPNYPLVFDSEYKRSIAINIIPSSDLKKFNFTMTFNGRDAGMSREINGEIYIIDKAGNELEYNPKIGFLPKWTTSWQTGQDNLKLDRKEIIFKTTPVLVFIDEKYGNPEEDIEMASLYKSSKNIMEFVNSKDFKAPLC